jgi:Tol biopolymer transport system component
MRRITSILLRRWWLSLIALLLLSMTACSPRITLPPLPVLHQPGVAPVPGFDRFLQNLDAYPKDRLEALTAYQPHDATQPASAHALLVIGDGLYDLSLDGANAQKAPMQNACHDRPAVTRDGRWLLCAAAAGMVALDLQTPALNNWQMALLTATGTAPFYGPHPRLAAWGPDNRHFVVDMDRPDGCVLGLYVADPPFKEAQLVTQLTFPSLDDTCDIEDVGWSPDGQWLAFIAQLPLGAGVTDHLFALDLRAFPLSQDADAVAQVAVPSSALVDLGGAGTSLTWPATPHTITMAGYESIFEVDLLTHERHTLLTQQEVQFCTASWTPDGATLVFILCRPGTNPDVASAPLAQLYTYTPTSGSHSAVCWKVK